MQAFLTRFLLLISIAIFWSACATPKHLLPLKNGQKTRLSNKNFKPTFKGEFRSMLFKATITYSDKFDFSGMLALKQMSEGNYRAVFMAMSGSTIFDFEFGKNKFVVHKIIRAFNRKILLKIIEKDFSMFLANNILGSKATIYQKGRLLHRKKIIKTKNKGKRYFFVQGRHNRLVEIHQGRKVSIDLSHYLIKVPRKINIQHHKIPLQLKLLLIKR